MDLTVSPGDKVHVTIEEQAADDWLIQMTDGSQTASQVVAYPMSTDEQTAEFIQEFTNGGQPGVALTNTDPVLFQDACYATAIPPSGKAPTWTGLGGGWGGQVTEMVLRNSTYTNPVLNNADSDATPSEFSGSTASPNKTGFYVAPYSLSAPAPPASGGNC